MQAKNFSDLITFTRATSGGRFNGAGLFEMVPVNGPRFDYDPLTLAPKGLLIESQATNLLRYSAQIDDATWTKTNATVSANSSTSPDGGVTADKIIESAVNSTHLVIQTVTTSAGIYTLSVFAKAGERKFVQLRAQENAGFLALAVFDLLLGTVQSGSATALISPVGNGWYRCSISVTSVGSATFQGQAWVLNNSAQVTYLGDGVSGLYIWGVQLEAGAFRSSLIPTTSAAVTRAADIASLNTISPWYKSTEGTLSAVATNNGGGGTTIAQLGTGVSDRVLVSVTTPGAVGSGGDTVVSSVGQATLQTALGTAGQKVAYAYAVNNFACAVNGVLIGTDSSGSLPTVSALLLGSNGAVQTNCYIRSIQYNPRRLSNAELQALTT